MSKQLTAKQRASKRPGPIHGVIQSDSPVSPLLSDKPRATEKGRAGARLMSASAASLFVNVGSRGPGFPFKRKGQQQPAGSAHVHEVGQVPTRLIVSLNLFTSELSHWPWRNQPLATLSIRQQRVKLRAGRDNRCGHVGNLSFCQKCCWLTSNCTQSPLRQNQQTVQRWTLLCQCDSRQPLTAASVNGAQACPG